MKAYQNKEGKLVIDGEGCIVPVTYDFISHEAVKIINFTFDGRKTKEPEILEVDHIFVGLRCSGSLITFEKAADSPIRISIPFANLGRVDGKLMSSHCAGQILSPEDARKIGKKLLELADKCEEYLKNED